MGFLDKLMPFFVGHRTEITTVAVGAANLLCLAVPAAAPVVATVNAFAPYAVALFAAARATRASK